MPVTVDFNQKDRVKPKRGVKGAPIVTGFNRYALTTARKNGQIALAIWIGILVVICLPWWLSEATLPFAIGMPLWCLLAAVGVLFVAPNSLASKLRKTGKDTVIGTNNQAPIKALMGKTAKFYGIPEPQGFIETPVAPVVKAPKKTKAAPKKAPKAAPKKAPKAAPKKVPKLVAKFQNEDEEATDCAA